MATSDPASGSDSANGAETLAARHLRQQSAGVLLRVKPAAQTVAARDDAGDAHPGAGQLLGDQAVLEDAEAEAAVLLRNQDAEVAELAELLAQLASGSRPAPDRACWRAAAPRSSRTRAPRRGSPGALRSGRRRNALLTPLRSFMRRPLRDEVGARVAHDHLVALVATFGAPGDDAEVRALARTRASTPPCCAPSAYRPGRRGSGSRTLVDAEERAAGFATGPRPRGRRRCTARAADR